LFSQVLLYYFLLIFIAVALFLFVIGSVESVRFSGQIGQNAREDASATDDNVMWFKVATLDLEGFLNEVRIPRTYFNLELELFMAHHFPFQRSHFH